MENYRPRIIDAILRDELEAFGAVLIVGPKWCGKTTSASCAAKSILKMQDPDNAERYSKIAKLKPSKLLKGERPRLIDEWQTTPVIWDAVRCSVDEFGEPGMYILTGSTDIDWKKIDHSGIGRIVRLRMNTMSLFESGDSTGEISLKTLFGKPTDIEGTSNASIEDVASMLIRGGWPQSIGKSRKVQSALIKGYCRSLIETEINLPDGRKRNKMRMEALLRALSRRTSCPMAKQGIIDDMSSYDGTDISTNTLNEYLETLRMLYVLDEMPAWNVNFRSKTAVRTTSTIHLCDSAIAAYFLGASAEDLLSDPSMFGLLFESMAVHDLRVYAGGLGGEIWHYRDSRGIEADAVLRLDNGKWAAFEVKLGTNWADEGAASLIRLKNASVKEPEFLAVIVPGGYAYRRPDGVYVVPLTCLRD